MSIAAGLPIDTWVTYTGTQTGRDKLYRLVQYLARFLATRYTGETSTKLTKLSGALGNGRKLFRLAKPIENINAILKATNIADPVVQYCTIGRNAGLGTWLFFDMIQYFHGIGVIKVDDIKGVGVYASRAWFIGLLFSTVMDLYKLQKNMAKAAKASRGSDEPSRKELRALEAERFGIILDTVRDSLDLAIPGSALEYIKIDTGLVGLIGTITSIIGIYQTWPSKK